MSSNNIRKKTAFFKRVNMRSAETIKCDFRQSNSDYNKNIKPPDNRDEHGKINMFAKICEAKKSDIPDKVQAVAKSLGLKLQEEDGIIEVFGSQYVAERFYKIVKKMVDKKNLRFIFSSELKDIRDRLSNKDSRIANIVQKVTVAEMVQDEYKSIVFPAPKEESGILSIQDELDLIDSKIAKDIVGFRKTGYGAWITEDGDVIKVQDRSEHEMKANQYIAENIDNVDLDELNNKGIYDYVFENGWVRIVWKSALNVQYYGRYVNNKAKKTLSKLMDDNYFDFYVLDVNEPSFHDSTYDYDEMLRWIRKY